MPLMIFLLQPVDKQSFLDSGIFCCLIHILNALLAPDGGSHLKTSSENEDLSTFDENRPARKLEVFISFPPFVFEVSSRIMLYLKYRNMLFTILCLFILRRSLLSGEVYSWILHSLNTQGPLVYNLENSHQAKLVLSG